MGTWSASRKEVHTKHHWNELGEIEVKERRKNNIWFAWYYGPLTGRTSSEPFERQRTNETDMWSTYIIKWSSRASAKSIGHGLSGRLCASGNDRRVGTKASEDKHT